jgi:hypothetical protein
MPPRRVLKPSKAKAIKNVPNDTQESSLGLAALVPPPPAGQVRRTHSRVPVSSILSNSGRYNLFYCYKAQVVKDVHREPQGGSSAPAPPLPSHPSTGRGQRTRSRVQVSLLYLSYVFYL